MARGARGNAVRAKSRPPPKLVQSSQFSLSENGGSAQCQRKCRSPRVQPRARISPFVQKKQCNSALIPRAVPFVCACVCKRKQFRSAVAGCAHPTGEWHIGRVPRHAGTPYARGIRAARLLQWWWWGGGEPQQHRGRRQNRILPPLYTPRMFTPSCPSSVRRQNKHTHLYPHLEIIFESIRIIQHDRTEKITTTHFVVVVFLRSLFGITVC